MLAVNRVRFVGDTAAARRSAWFVTGAALLALLLGGFSAGAWQLAQVNGWETGMRSFHAGDPFPWFWVVLSVAASGWLATVAVRAWRRVRALEADDRARRR